MPARDNRTGLASLAPELILRIADLADHRSQVSLACAARYFSECLYHRFRRHQAAYKKYRVSSDLDPATVPHLVRSVLGYADPLDAYHVRSFELWGTRGSWDEWRPFNVEASTPYTLQDGEPLALSFLDGETEKLMGVFPKMPEEHQEAARNELREGKDGFLKVAFLALLPRLIDVKIVSGASEESLFWLANGVQWAHQGTSWPPGFAGVRDLAVGMLSGTWRDKHRERLSAFTLASVLLLPRLESLYFSSVDTDYDEDSGLDTGGHRHADVLESMPRNIPIQRLVLDDVGDLELCFVHNLLVAPRSLEALSIRPTRGPLGGDQRMLNDSDQYATVLARSQQESLRRLMLYHPECLNGYRCDVFYPEELDPCENLRQVCLSVLDIELQALGADHVESGRDKFMDTFVKALPPSLEVLVLHGHTGVHAVGQDFHTEFLDDAVADLIRSRHRPSLKAVYLDQVETARYDGPESKRLLFPKSMAEGGKPLGCVDVYTRTNRDKKHHKLDVLTPPGRYDLLSGPHGRRGKDGLVLDMFTGEWGPPGCDACGRCEACREVYTPEMWETIRPDNGSN